MSKRILRQGTKHFRYFHQTGEPVRDSILLNYLKTLAIPPAWKSVQINPSPRAKIIATGYDIAGRKQYLYNPNFRAAQEKKKFDRLHAFANSLPMMRAITGQHLRSRQLNREKVLACMVRLIDQAYFRVGSERYAKENHTFGIATLRSRHLTIQGDKLIFNYVGKANQVQHKEVHDSRLARIVAEVDDLPGYEIFKYYTEHGDIVDVTSTDLNAYIKEVMGYDFSAKDFRTWAGTLVAAVALAETKKCDLDSQEAKRNVTEAIKTVAEKLGNTPAIAKSSYIDPRIIDQYLSGATIKGYLLRINQYLKNPELEGLSPEEIAVLKLLKRRLKATTPSA